MQIDNPTQEVVVVGAAVAAAEGFSLDKLAGPAGGFGSEPGEHAATQMQTSAAMTTSPMTPSPRIIFSADEHAVTRAVGSDASYISANTGRMVAAI